MNGGGNTAVVNVAVGRQQVDINTCAVMYQRQQPAYFGKAFTVDLNPGGTLGERLNGLWYMEAECTPGLLSLLNWDAAEGSGTKVIAEGVVGSGPCGLCFLCSKR